MKEKKGMWSKTMEEEDDKEKKRKVGAILTAMER